MRNRPGRAAKRWTTALLVTAGLLGATGAAQAVLQARDLTGDTVTDAYYDTALNITWLKDANAAGVNMNWAAANSWAAGLVFGGYDDWRLANINNTSPTVSMPACSPGGGAAACAANGNELGYMYLFNMDGAGNNTGTQTFGGATLDNVQPAYWAGTEFSPGIAWVVPFGLGSLDGVYDEHLQFSAWAVRPGDVIAAPIPEPETYAMLLAGLGLLGFAARRRKQKAA